MITQTRWCLRVEVAVCSDRSAALRGKFNFAPKWTQRIRSNRIELNWIRCHQTDGRRNRSGAIDWHTIYHASHASGMIFECNWIASGWIGGERTAPHPPNNRWTELFHSAPQTRLAAWLCDIVDSFVLVIWSLWLLLRWCSMVAGVRVRVGLGVEWLAAWPTNSAQKRNKQGAPGTVTDLYIKRQFVFSLTVPWFFVPQTGRIQSNQPNRFDSSNRITDTHIHNSTQ